jgi:hypothetical protein
MRWIYLLLLAALALLVPAAPAAAQVTDEYALTHLQGQAIPARSPDEDNVMVHGAEILLGEDGRYTFRLQASSENQDTVEHHEATGSYRVEGDTLFLEMDDGSDPIPVAYELEDGRLTMRVPAGYTYTFQRR